MTPRRLPPGPPGRWPLGNLPEFRRDMLGFFTRSAREYGDLVMLRLGPRKVHLASHPDFVEQVLVTENKKFGKSYVFELLRPVLGNGLLNSEGDFWLRQRRLMQPAFTRASVNNYGGVIVDHTQRLLAKWNSGQLTDLQREMSTLTLGIVGQALMDIDLGDVSNEVAAPLESAMHDFSHRFESAWNFPNWVPTPRNRRAKRNVRKLDAVVNRIIRQRREAGGDRGDLLSKLLVARDEVDQTGMTDRQLRDEVMTLFLAGHETSANALVWTWFLLAQHADVQRRLLDELNTVVGNRWPEVDDVLKLPYTEAVVKESLRMFPPAFAFSRRVLADATIGGYHIPAGTAVIMSQWVIHRDPRWFKQPDRFMPERWLEETPLPSRERLGEGAARTEESAVASPRQAPSRKPQNTAADRPAYAYFPFGGGPRGCIGNTFAMLETMLVVAAIAPRFRFELITPDRVRPWPSVTLRPAAGVPAVIHSRAAAEVPAM